MTAVAKPFSNESGTARREERLLRLLERASASSRFNLGERWLFAFGGALVVAGFVVVIIGWSGASRTVLVAGQIPYLLSGGMIGLGLIFLGGFLYFGHWLAVLVRESRERGAEDREDLAVVRRSLDETNRNLAALTAALTTTLAPLSSGPAGRAPVNETSQADTARPDTAGPETAAWASGSPSDVTAPVLLATATGTMAHRPGCRALAGKPNVRPVEMADRLRPCGMCRPLDQLALQ